MKQRARHIAKTGSFQPVSILTPVFHEHLTNQTERQFPENIFMYMYKSIHSEQPGTRTCFTVPLYTCI